MAITRSENGGAREHDRPIVFPGVIAGLVAVLVLGLIMCVGEAMMGRGFWRPMQLIGAFFLGDEWTTQTVLAAILGVAVHLAIGAAWGVLFAAFVRRVPDLSMLAMFGILFGAAVFAIMTFAVLPWASPLFTQGIHLGRYFIAHLVFGLLLGVTLPSAARVRDMQRTLKLRRRSA